MLPLADDWQNYASSELSAEQLPDGKSATYGAEVAKVWFRFGKLSVKAHVLLLFMI